jgi:hypothetical protein
MDKDTVERDARSLIHLHRGAVILVGAFTHVLGGLTQVISAARPSKAADRFPHNAW